MVLNKRPYTKGSPFGRKAVLSMIAKEPMSSYQIEDALAQRDMYPEGKHISVVLNHLEAQGLAKPDKYVLCECCKRRMTVYNITPKGRAYLAWKGV